MSRIVLHIDRLVLRGIDPTDAKAISTGLQTELQRLLATPEIAPTLARSGDRFLIDGGSVTFAANTPGKSLGQAIGGKIAKGVRP